MKNDRLHFACQLAGNISLDEDSNSDWSESNATVIRMGIQPVSRANRHMPDLMLLEPSGSEQCHCLRMPQDRTILHGILTGNGHKFGYGAGTVTCLNTHDRSRSHTDALGLHADGCRNSVTSQNDNHQMDHSHGVTLPSKCITPPPDK